MEKENIITLKNIIFDLEINAVSSVLIYFGCDSSKLYYFRRYLREFIIFETNNHMLNTSVFYDDKKHSLAMRIRNNEPYKHDERKYDHISNTEFRLTN